MRRQRLVYEQRLAAEETGAVSPAPPGERPFADFRRRELRALVARFSASFEELLAFVMNEGEP